MRHKVIEENASFNLLSSQDVQEGTSKHQSFKNVAITMFNKDRHTAKVNLQKNNKKEKNINVQYVYI
jgi:hypothetical protein